ncbi:MAG: phytanoyl-CoA dioxygenase family protein [Candidatus Dormibacteria bacterium]
MEERTHMPSADTEQFKTFGFVTWREALSPDEVKQIEDELIVAMEQAYAATPFDGTVRHWLPLLSPLTPKIASLGEDPRFYAKARELVEDDVVLFIVDGNRYISPTHWHPDGEPTTHGVKFFIYLGNLGAETGALRVVPGSHKEPFHDAVKAFAGREDVEVPDIPAYVFNCQPGDVLAFDYPMWHASVGGSKDRRMCTIEYYKKPATEVEATSIREHHALITRAVDETFKRQGFPFYDQAWLDAPDQSDVRREIVAGMREAGMLDNPANLGLAGAAPATT